MPSASPRNDARAPVGPGDAKDANVSGAAAHLRAELGEALLDAPAGDVEVPLLARPATRMDPGFAVEGVNRHA